MTATTLLHHLKLLPPPESQAVQQAREEMLRVTHWRNLVEACRLVLESGIGVTPRCVAELLASISAADQILAADEVELGKALGRELAEWRNGQGGEGGR